MALAPLTAGHAAADSEDGAGLEFNKITICHRTNAETNPYVQITIAKDAVFRQGHDGHDEGGVHRPGDKAAGIRWGDIIPTFEYYAGRQNTDPQTYPGLNNGPDGQLFLANGCNSPTPPPPEEEPEPAGTLSGECVEDGESAGGFVVSGTLDDDGSEDVSFRLLLSADDPISLSESTFRLTLDAAPGTTVQLQYSVDGGETWTDTDDAVTVTECPPQPVDATGGFTVVCDADGAVVTIGSLSTEPGVTFRLFVNGTPQQVESGQVIHVAGGAALDLKSRYQGVDTSEQTATAPPACPTLQAAGSFTTECTPTAAQADVGTLNEGTFRNGTYRLVATNFSVTVTSGQQNVAVPASTTLTLEYAPNGQAAAALPLDTETSPAACPEKGVVDKESAPASGSAVPAGSTIRYTVTVRNTGTVTLTDKSVVDTLPTFVTVQGTPSDGGVVSADGRTITWTVTLAPQANKTFTYTGLVSANAPAGTALVNTVTFLDQTDATRHTVGSSGLQIVKEVAAPQPAQQGSVLTYTLRITALGDLAQTGVTVSDEIPAGTSYVLGSIGCPDGGMCDPTVANGVARWNLGSMSPGDTRTAAFQVRVETAAATTIRNVALTRSDQVGTTTSNEVETPLTVVAGVKTGQPAPTDTEGATPETVVAGVKTGQPAPTDTEGATPETVVQGTKSGPTVLAATGSGIPLSGMVALAGLLLLMGAALLRVSRGSRS